MEQIECLENVALPSARAVLVVETGKPKAADVGAEFLKLSKALGAAQKVLLRLQSSDVRAVAQARLRILTVDAAIKANQGVLAAALHAVAVLQRLVKRADEHRPRTAVRRQVASGAPVKFIADALLTGWVKAHPKWLRTSLDMQVDPVLPVNIASTVDGVFMEIVTVCYEAIGAENTAPQRAVREFLRRRGLAEQNASEKPDVPS